MPNRMCAPWCGRPAERYGIICQDHWVTLDQYDRERIRDSFRRTHGTAAYFRHVLGEVGALKASMRGLVSHG